MMITWRTQNLTQQQYKNNRYSTLLKVEESGTPQTRPYVDTQDDPAPTMGVGFKRMAA